MQTSFTFRNMEAGEWLSRSKTVGQRYKSAGQGRGKGNDPCHRQCHR